MAQVRWTDEAERWLSEIYESIAADNPEAAWRTTRGIIEKADDLREFPLLGYRYPNRPDRHYRILWYGHYRIAYLVIDEELIDIVGIYHHALDIEQIL